MDVLNKVVNFISLIFTTQVFSVLFNAYYNTDKKHIEKVQQLSKELSKNIVDKHFVEVLFGAIYNAQYVYYDEIVLIMNQRNPTELAKIYARINRIFKYTEIRCVGGRLEIRYSKFLETIEKRVMFFFISMVIAVSAYFSMYIPCDKIIELMFSSLSGFNKFLIVINGLLVILLMFISLFFTYVTSIFIKNFFRVIIFTKVSDFTLC
ncbi:hypothetical protein [Citrobacter koseri]|uniref:hypothetical protein n=1 Tax=Citrobacter koseri TaxID=545 RepID=UPI003892475D